MLRKWSTLLGWGFHEVWEIRKMLRIAGCLTLCSFGFANVTAPQEAVPIETELKARLPEWRPQVAEQYPNGTPRLIFFYSENDAGQEVAVKRVHLFENGRPLEESDLTVVEEGSPGYEFWKSRIVPHGVTVRFRETGELERIGYYNEGLLHGPLKVFFPKGKVQHVTHYKHGQPHGQIISYHENGQLMAEGIYVDGKLEGDYIRYFSSGEREALFPYKDGMIHGKATEWYENGKEHTIRNYLEGKLHSDRKQPGLIVYRDDHSIEEIQDFKEGLPHGSHVKYHLNDRKAYFAHYEEGKLHGKEQYFDPKGKLQGEGDHRHGMRLGKHWRKHENGTTAYVALYDKKGRLKEAIREFDEDGQKIAEYYKDEEGKFDGPFHSWFSNGQTKVDCHYVHGEFDGPQKEYFKNGNLHFIGNYHDQLRDGDFKEWYENGTLAFEGTFINGNKEGPFNQWYEDGTQKAAQNFKHSLFHGNQIEWYENGQKHLETCLEDGKRSGTHRLWNTEGQLLFEGAYEKDAPIGTHISFYPSGTKREVIHFEHGKKEGLHEIFYENGQLQLTETFAADKREGESRGYYADGSVFFIRTFKEDLPIGEQKEYFSPDTEGAKPGQLASLYTYNQAGQMDGDQITFFPSGVTKTSISYKNGELNGMKALWDKDGNLLEDSKYVKGKLEGRFFQKDQEGREIVYHYKNNRRDGHHQIFYPVDVTEGEKIKALEATFIGNKLEGEVHEYDPSGKKIRTSFYVANRKEGPTVLYHQSGVPALKLNFSNDKREGLSEHFYPSGKLYREVRFVNDQKEGEEKTYFENGELISIYNYHSDQLDGHAEHYNEEGTLIFEAEYINGLQHGRFAKFYDDGKPRLEQNYVDGKLDGIKKSWDAEGNLTEVRYKDGSRIE